MHYIAIVDATPAHVEWLATAATGHWPNATLLCARTAQDAHQLLDALPQHSSGIAFIGLSLPEGSGIELIRRLAGPHGPALMPVATTASDHDPQVFLALAAGAQGCIVNDLDPQAMDEHLQHIQAGTPPISAAVARRMLAYFRDTATANEPSLACPEPTLTAREVDVLRMIGRGLRVAEAARLLGLSEQTVAGYVKTLYRKLDVSSRAEAALEAARRGLV